jgi:hypothetical protein
MSKKQILLTNFFIKNKPVESTDHEAGLPDANWTEVSSPNTATSLWLVKKHFYSSRKEYYLPD